MNQYDGRDDILSIIRKAGRTPVEHEPATEFEEVGTVQFVATFRRKSYELTQLCVVGAPAGAAVGLPALRAKCPYFNAWVGRLERLGGNMYLKRSSTVVELKQ